MAEPEEALEDPRDVSRKPVTEHLGATLALAASLSVIVSFIYDWGSSQHLALNLRRLRLAYPIM